MLILGGNKIMYTVLLRAYFDLFGNFENIINVPFYDILNKSAKQKSLTIINYRGG